MKSLKIQKNSKKAFTVAEILVTLAVIGVVASFVVSMIKLKYQEVTTVSKLRKVYSMINNSYQQAIRKYGPLKYWNLAKGTWEKGDDDTTENDDAAFFADAEKLYSRLLDGLNAENVSDVLPLQATNYFGNEDKAITVTDGFELQPLYRLPDGTTFFQSWIEKPDCTWSVGVDDRAFYVCGDFRADINGADPPNIVGIDQFQFWITSNAIIPMGYPKEKRSADKFCVVDKATMPPRNGYGCAAWAIEKGEMPWLYGKQVKW